MQIEITFHFKQFQFWHSDCAKGRGGIMECTNLDKETGMRTFHCVSCGKSGEVHLPNLMVGQGTAVEVTDKAGE